MDAAFTATYCISAVSSKSATYTHHPKWCETRCSVGANFSCLQYRSVSRWEIEAQRRLLWCFLPDGCLSAACQHLSHSRSAAEARKTETRRESGVWGEKKKYYSNAVSSITMRAVLLGYWKLISEFVCEDIKDWHNLSLLCQIEL